MRMLAAILISIPLPVLADEICDDLWFTRNLIMDRAGYCFGSVLGKSVSENSDCTGKSVSLSSAETSMVGQIRGLEEELGCKVNTAQPVLSLEEMDVRRRLTDLPVRAEFESACIGWLGERIQLKAGHQPDAGVVGEISPGDTIGYSHQGIGSWEYVVVKDRDWRFKSAGWTDQTFGMAICEQVAG